MQIDPQPQTRNRGTILEEQLAILEHLDALLDAESRALVEFAHADLDEMTSKKAGLDASFYALYQEFTTATGDIAVEQRRRYQAMTARVREKSERNMLRMRASLDTIETLTRTLSQPSEAASGYGPKRKGYTHGRARSLLTNTLG